LKKQIKKKKMDYLKEENCNKKHCKTCIFHPDASRRIHLSDARTAEINAYLKSFKSSHVCHQTEKTCYGGLEVQAKTMFEMKLITEPTVDCFFSDRKIISKMKGILRQNKDGKWIVSDKEMNSPELSWCTEIPLDAGQLLPQDLLAKYIENNNNGVGIDFEIVDVNATVLCSKPSWVAKLIGDKENQLLEDYKRRLKTIMKEIENISFTDESLGIETRKRLETKASCYRTFISELERL